MVIKPHPKTTVTFVDCGDQICMERSNKASEGWPCLGGHLNGDLSIGLTPETFPNFSFTPRELETIQLSNKWPEVKEKIRNSWSRCGKSCKMYKDDRLFTCLPAQFLVRVRNHIQAENARRTDTDEPRHKTINVRPVKPNVDEDELEEGRVLKRSKKKAKGKGGLKTTKPVYGQPIPWKGDWISIPLVDMDDGQRRCYNNLNTVKYRARKERKDALMNCAQNSWAKYNEIIPPPSILDIVPAKMPIWMECIPEGLVDALECGTLSARRTFYALKTKRRRLHDELMVEKNQLSEYIGDPTMSTQDWMEIIVHDKIKDLQAESRTPRHFLADYTPPYEHELEDAKRFRSLLNKSRIALGAVKRTLKVLPRDHPIWNATSDDWDSTPDAVGMQRYLGQGAAKIHWNDKYLQQAKRMLPPVDEESPLTVAMYREVSRRKQRIHETKRLNYVRAELQDVAAKYDAKFKRQYNDRVMFYLKASERAADVLSQNPEAKKVPNTRILKPFLEEAKIEEAKNGKDKDKGKGKGPVQRPGRPAGAKTGAKAAKEGGGAGVHQIITRVQTPAGACTDKDMPEDKGASSLVKRKAHAPARSTGGKADGRKKVRSAPKTSEEQTAHDEAEDFQSEESENDRAPEESGEETVEGEGVKGLASKKDLWEESDGDTGEE